MRELPRSSKYVATPDLPLDDEERNRLVARLNEAFAAGEVSSDDYHRHLDTLFAARRLGEVVPVVQHLPRVATHDTPALVEVGTGRPGELTPASSPRPMATLLLLAAGGVAVMMLVIVLVVVFGLVLW